jgi:hypothetical protein
MTETDLKRRLDEHHEDRQRGNDDRDLHDPVNPAVAEDPDDRGRDDQDQDPRGDAQGADDPLRALRLDDELRRDEADVEEQDAREQERRAVEAELAAGLDGLRHAEAGPLGRVQGDEQGAGQGTGHDRHDGPPEREAERDDHPAEEDVEHVHVGARPEGGLLPGFPVPGRGRDHVDVMRLARMPEVSRAGFLRSGYIASRCGRRQAANRGQYSGLSRRN